MRESDVDAFVEMLSDVYGLYPNAKPLTEGQVAMFVRAVRDYSMRQIRADFDAHVRSADRGRFPPLPADVIAQIERRAADDGRPGAEEAWATAIRGADEAETIVWTNETAAAWSIAKPVFDLGDEVGARMAFKDAYGRLVAAARAGGKAAVWQPSLGHDPQRRAAALGTAVASGLLPAPSVAGLLPPPEAVSGEIAPNVREALLALRERIVSEGEAESADAAAKRATAEAQEEIARRVAEYQRRQA
jgi:hypothetical protein